MGQSISSEQFSKELMFLLTESFESVQGIYLDQGGSLLETLAGITAEEASIPVGNQCATIAAQVTHVIFYLDLTNRYIETGQNEKVDWGEIWRTVREITPQDWAALQERLRQTYQRTCDLAKSYDHWEVENSIAGAMGLVAHTAYHLGEIRQATCTIQKK